MPWPGGPGARPKINWSWRSVQYHPKLERSHETQSRRPLVVANPEELWQAVKARIRQVDPSIEFTESPELF